VNELDPCPSEQHAFYDFSRRCAEEELMDQRPLNLPLDRSALSVLAMKRGPQF